MIHFDSQELDSLVVIVSQFLLDKFISIIDKWKAKKTSQLSLDSLGTKDELGNDLDEGILSTRSLNIISDDMDLSSVVGLAKIMVKSCQFIQWDQRTENQESSRRLIIPALLPPASNFRSHLTRREGTKTLVYFFHHLQEANKVKSSGFFPAGFLPQLTASLLEEKQNRTTWEKDEIIYNGASFGTGTKGDIWVMISSQGCVIKLNIQIVQQPECCDINSDSCMARHEFEQEVFIVDG